MSLVKFSYWLKFHVNVITGSEVMRISFYKGLTRSSEIGNTPVSVLPNIWRLGQKRIWNLARTFLIKCYWILRNARLTAFTVSNLLKKNQQWGKNYPPIPRIKVKRFWYLQEYCICPSLIVIYLCIHEKRFQSDYVTKISDNRLIKLILIGWGFIKQ